jgi:hypothetical protein
MAYNRVKHLPFYLGDDSMPHMKDDFLNPLPLPDAKRIFAEAYNEAKLTRAADGELIVFNDPIMEHAEGGEGVGATDVEQRGELYFEDTDDLVRLRKYCLEKAIALVTATSSQNWHNHNTVTDTAAAFEKYILRKG